MANPGPSGGPSRRGLFIDGEFRDPARGGWLPVINPATEAVIGEIPAATSDDVDAAVSAAARAAAAKEWTTSSGAYRAGFLRAIAQKVGSPRGRRASQRFGQRAPRASLSPLRASKPCLEALPRHNLLLLPSCPPPLGCSGEFRCATTRPPWPGWRP